MTTIVSQRLNEGAAPVFYPAPEIQSALNEANRLFALMTLCVERTAPWNVPANTTFFHMLTFFPDWLAPLRIGTPAGSKVRPSRLSELWAINSQWPKSPGVPSRYASMGGDLVALYPQSAIALPVRYAAAPAALVNAVDSSEIPADYHELLPKFAIYRMRMVEGAAPLESVLPLLGEFLDGAVAYAAYVRARNVAASYDTMPPELAGFDRSRLIPRTTPKPKAAK